jgi:penicillin-binding protein 1B
MSNGDKPSNPQKRKRRPVVKKTKKGSGPKKNQPQSRRSKGPKSKTQMSPSSKSISSKKKRRAKPKRRRKLNQTSAYLVRVSISLFLGILAGTLLCGYAIYASAEQDVQVWLQPQEAVTDTPSGKAWSAPVRLWRGAKIPLEAVVDILQSSGYTKVAQLEAPLDFTVLGTSLVIDNRENKLGQDEGVYTVNFNNGDISSIQNKKKKTVSEITLKPVLLSTFRKANTIPKSDIQIENIPEHIPNAILAMEDSRFYQHEGVDVIGLARAIFINIISDSKSQGASTITQQLVKNLILNNSEKTYKRKAREALRAIALEKRLSKQELLQLYLNEVYLGQVNGMAVVGVEQAAKIYFGKEVHRLGVGEAAMISGIISAPNSYSPLRHPERAKERRDITLKRMRSLEWINEDTYQKEKNSKLLLNIVPIKRRANWYVDVLVEQVEMKQGEGAVASKALDIRSTLDPIVQYMLETAVKTSMAELDEKYPTAKGSQVAAVVMDSKTGEVLGLVGGRSYATSQFNRAFYAKRQVGSIAKPFLFGLLFNTNSNLSPGCWVKDQPLKIQIDNKVWSPANYDKRYNDFMTLRDALRTSRNIPTVEIYQYLKKQTNSKDFFVGFGKRVGLDSITDAPANALGSFTASPIELAAAYTIFANKGTYVEARLISDVRDQEGEIQYAPTRKTTKNVLHQRSAWMVESMLADVVLDGTAKTAVKYGAVGSLAGKTGTTNQANDAWFVGYDQRYIVAVWVGFDKGKALGLTGGQAALPAWSRFMSSVGNDRPNTFALVSSVKKRSVCSDWPECLEQSDDWFYIAAPKDKYCAIFEHEKTTFLERIIPEINIKKQEKKEQTNTEENNNKEEGILFRIFPWRNKDK